jgi:PPOX class probable F420-dependent enzyme
MTPVAGEAASLADNHHRHKPNQNRHQEMTTMLDPNVRRVLDGTSIAHLASVLPDGAPHSVPVWVGTHGDHVAILTGPGTRKARNLRRDPRVALSLTPADNPFQPVVVRGKVVEWIEGDAAWEVVDRISTKYIGGPYSRDKERVVALIEPDWQSMG